MIIHSFPAPHVRTGLWKNHFVLGIIQLHQTAQLLISVVTSHTQGPLFWKGFIVWRSSVHWFSHSFYKETSTSLSILLMCAMCLWKQKYQKCTCMAWAECIQCTWLCFMSHALTYKNGGWQQRVIRFLRVSVMISFKPFRITSAL